MMGFRAPTVGGAGGGCPPGSPQTLSLVTAQGIGRNWGPQHYRPPLTLSSAPHTGRVSVSPSAEAPSGEARGVRGGKGPLEAQVAHSPAGDRRTKGCGSWPQGLAASGLDFSGVCPVGFACAGLCLLIYKMGVMMATSRGNFKWDQQPPCA